jgi:putative DNA methylase
VKLLNRDELEPNWNPNLDERLTVWEMTHYLIKALESDGEMGAASLMTALGDRSWAAKELAFRLYGICNDNKWAKIAIGYNSLASQWSEIQRLSSEALI